MWRMLSVKPFDSVFVHRFIYDFNKNLVNYHMKFDNSFILSIRALYETNFICSVYSEYWIAKGRIIKKSYDYCDIYCCNLICIIIINHHRRRRGFRCLFGFSVDKNHNDNLQCLISRWTPTCFLHFYEVTDRKWLL